MADMARRTWPGGRGQADVARRTWPINLIKCFFSWQVFFTRQSKLVVEVVMARDMHRDDDVISTGSHTSHGLLGINASTHHQQPICPYVKVQLVPFEWFPGGLTHSTKVMKKSDPAIFQETFT